MKSGKIITSKITKLWKTPTPFKKILRIHLDNGEIIETTPNHLFYSICANKFDFIQARNLKVEDYIGYKEQFIRKQKTILAEEDFFNTYINKQRQRIIKWFSDDKQRLKPSEAHTIDKLRKLKLLPLHSNSENTIILARLMGFIFGDGHINYHKSKNRSDYPICCFTASEKDLERIRKDIDKLGIKVRRKLVRHSAHISTL